MSIALFAIVFAIFGFGVVYMLRRIISVRNEPSYTYTMKDGVETVEIQE